VPETSHQPDDRLELYALGRLPEADLAIVEEHLLVCTSCQERLDELELFAIAMRQAIAAEPAVQERSGWFVWLRGTLRPQLIWAVGFAAIILTAVLYLHPGRNVAPLASLDLASVRGAVQEVREARETDLTLTDAPYQSGLRAEVVDYKGEQVWSGQPTAGSGQIRIARQLTPGSYFVRLFDESGKLMHEYGFNVQNIPAINR